MQWWWTLVLFAAGAAATGAVLRLQAAFRRGRALSQLMRAEHATWAALCRVKSGGHFLDHGRGRGGGGPRGVLLADDFKLRWRPDNYERTHGDQSMSWPIDQVLCRRSSRYRDITGLAAEKIAISVPEGDVTLVAFHPAGTKPSVLDAPQTRD